MSTLNGDIVLITNKEASINWSWEKDSDKVDKRLQIISLDDLKNTDGILIQNKLGLPITPIEGMMLAKNPFNDKVYIDVNDFQDYMADEKFNAVCKIASLLGAKKIFYKYAVKDIKQRDTIVDGRVSYKVFEGEAEYKRKLSESRNFNSTKVMDFPGNRCDIDAYNKAVAEAERTGLINDKDVKTLLFIRHPDHPNAMSHLDIQICLSRETNANTEIAFSISVLGGKVFSLNIGVNDTISTVSTLKLHTEWFFESH